MNDLKLCGVGDILIAVVDGLKGFPEAITTVLRLDPGHARIAMLRRVRVYTLNGAVLNSNHSYLLNTIALRVSSPVKFNHLFVGHLINNSSPANITGPNTTANI